VRYVIVVEEAHNIVGRSTTTTLSEDVVDPKSFASQYICRMLAELRALKVGILIVDQLPSTVAPEVIKNTSAKLAFRQVAKDDREELGGTMLCREDEIEEFARLEPGDAFFFMEGFHGPRRIKTERLHERADLASPPLGERLLEYIRDELWFRNAAASRSAEVERRCLELGDLYGEIGVFCEHVKRINSESRELSNRLRTASSLHKGEEKAKVLEGIIRKSEGFRTELRSRYNSFRRNVYEPQIGPEVSSRDVELSQVRELRSSAIRLFEEVAKKVTSSCLEKLEDFVLRARKAV